MAVRKLWISTASTNPVTMLIERKSDERGEWTIVSLHGALDFDHSGSVRKVLLWIVRTHDRVLADLSAVTHIDSAGIACIVEAYLTATKNDARFELAGANLQVMRMFRLTRLDKVLSIHQRGVTRLGGFSHPRLQVHRTPRKNNLPSAERRLVRATASISQGGLTAPLNEIDHQRKH